MTKGAKTNGKSFLWANAESEYKNNQDNLFLNSINGGIDPADIKKPISELLNFPEIEADKNIYSLLSRYLEEFQTLTSHIEVDRIRFLEFATGLIYVEYFLCTNLADMYETLPFEKLTDWDITEDISTPENRRRCAYSIFTDENKNYFPMAFRYGELINLFEDEEGCISINSEDAILISCAQSILINIRKISNLLKQAQTSQKQTYDLMSGIFPFIEYTNNDLLMGHTIKNETGKHIGSKSLASMGGKVRANNYAKMKRFALDLYSSGENNYPSKLQASKRMVREVQGFAEKNRLIPLSENNAEKTIYRWLCSP